MARFRRTSRATGARPRSRICGTRGLAGHRGPATGAARGRAAAGRHRHRRLPAGLSRSRRRAGPARPRRARRARRRVDSAVPQQDLSELHHHRHRAVAGAPRHRRQHDGRPGDRPAVHARRSRRAQRSALVAGRADLGDGRTAGPPRLRHVLARRRRRHWRAATVRLAALRRRLPGRGPRRSRARLVRPAVGRAAGAGDAVLQPGGRGLARGRAGLTTGARRGGGRRSRWSAGSSAVSSAAASAAASISSWSATTGWPRRGWTGSSCSTT